MNLYGVMFASGVFVAALLAEREAKRQGFSAEMVQQLVLWMMLGIVVGARLFYVLFYWPEDLPRTLIGTIAVWKGGLAFLGGFLGAVSAGYLFTRAKKLPFWRLADIFTIPLVIGHIIGRIGDYLTGAHPGAITDLPWGIPLHGAIRHPVVLYEILGLVIIVAALLVLRKRLRGDGMLFTAYVTLYALQRLILDVFRIPATDPRYLGMTPTQMGLVVIAALLIIYQYRGRRKQSAGFRKRTA
jgi:prolipoprotein diacylglyceryl transferase